MKVSVRSVGSATVINAIAIGKGSAFGIDLGIIASSKLSNSEIKCSSNLSVDTSLMELCAKKVMKHYCVSTGVNIKTESNLPLASGLSSSSALSNAVCKSLSDLISTEFDLKPMNDLEIINIAIDASLDANVTITGAFDDATASYFGGITVTDNINRELVIKEEFETYDVVIHTLPASSFTSDSNVDRMKLLSPLIETAYNMAVKKDYFNALNLNGLLYSSTLGFDSTIAIDALNAGALASGLSGTGSSFVAICHNHNIDDIIDIWNQYPGKTIKTKVNNQGTVRL